MDWDGEERRRSYFDKEFYDKMMEVHNNSKYVKAWIQEHEESDERIHALLDNRVKVLENDRMKIIGAAGAVGFFGGVFGFIGGIVVKLLFK